MIAIIDIPDESPEEIKLANSSSPKKSQGKLI